MCQISLVTEDNQFAQWLSADLQNDLDWKISQVNYLELSAYATGIDRLDILIVDHVSIEQLSIWHQISRQYWHVIQEYFKTRKKKNKHFLCQLN